MVYDSVVDDLNLKLAQAISEPDPALESIDPAMRESHRPARHGDAAVSEENGSAGTAEIFEDVGPRLGRDRAAAGRMGHRLFSRLVGGAGRSASERVSSGRGSHPGAAPDGRIPPCRRRLSRRRERHRCPRHLAVSGALELRERRDAGPGLGALDGATIRPAADGRLARRAAAADLQAAKSRRPAAADDCRRFRLKTSLPSARPYGSATSKSRRLRFSSPRSSWCIDRSRRISPRRSQLARPEIQADQPVE